MDTMTTSYTKYEDLADRLRDEMQEYGALYNLLKDQQKSLLERNSEGILLSNAKINEHLKSAERFRSARKGKVAELIEALSLDPQSALSEIITFVPQALQPMFEALIREVNTLLGRVRKVFDQNNLIILHTNEFIDGILQELDPDCPTKTYTPGGGLKARKGYAGQCVQVSA